MKFKFLRAFVATIICLITFLALTFIPSLRDLKMGDFLQGFSGGMGAIAMIAAIYYYIELQKEKKLSHEQ